MLTLFGHVMRLLGDKFEDGAINGPVVYIFRYYSGINVQPADLTTMYFELALARVKGHILLFNYL